MTNTILHPWTRILLVCIFLSLIIAELAIVQKIEILIAQSKDPTEASKNFNYNHSDPYYEMRNNVNI